MITASGKKFIYEFIVTGAGGRVDLPETGSACFKFGKFRFDRTCRGPVEFKKFFSRAVPHVGGFGRKAAAVIRLVPDLPVANVVVKSVCPAVDVVGDDMLADAGALQGFRSEGGAD